MSTELILLAWYLSMLFSLILGVFLAIRGVYRFLEWRDGDKEAILSFISLSVGVAAALIYTIGMIDYNLNYDVDVFANTMTALFILGIIAIGLSAFIVFRKWWKLK